MQYLGAAPLAYVRYFCFKAAMNRLAVRGRGYPLGLLVRLHVESRVHFVVKASHLCGYVKGSPVFPKTVVGTLGNACDSCRKRLKSYHTLTIGATL